ncbi:52 kDa repressor of the inhibitor of the protein kinase-like [Haliotis rubra]|uniref:52 kDa repressor of the inhibitor of the protein kinase-like n=1 Tax=Haliotis rubra TaxID=36100 RepID=UPI001EE514FA|nr:52 kDa repressor of the inhibitor of the protein kinase-like [Haliotis rubra]
MDQFKESLSSTSNDMKQREKLRTLCETRWSARADALFTFLSCFDVVVDALDNLKDMGDDKASSHLNNILRFDFIISLVTAEHVVQSTVVLSKVLQKKSVDLVEAVEEARVVKTVLRDERDDNGVWTELFQKAVEVGQNHDVEAKIPRLAGRQRHRVNVPAETPQVYYKRALYLPFVDHLLSEIEDRLVAPEGRFLAQGLIPSKLLALTADVEHEILAHYAAELPYHQGAENEIHRLVTKLSQVDRKPETILETLEGINQDLYPNIYTMLAILMTIPVATSTTERSFSMMRRVKTYLRSSMGQDRFSSLCLIHGHKDFPVRVDEVIAEKKARQLGLSIQGRKLTITHFIQIYLERLLIQFLVQFKACVLL